MSRCTRLQAGRNERKCPSSDRAFFIERLDGGSYDNIMAAMKNRKNQTADTLPQADEVQASIDYGIDITALIAFNEKHWCLRKAAPQDSYLGPRRKSRATERVSMCPWSTL